jgi:hypothetical protein
VLLHFLLKRYTTANSPAIANTASNPGVGVDVTVGVGDGVGVGVVIEDVGGLQILQGR